MEVQLVVHNSCLQIAPCVNFRRIHNSCLIIDENFVSDVTTYLVDNCPKHVNDKLDAIVILTNL